MRVALASIISQKHGLAENLAVHRGILDDARVQGCSLAVFGEMSLTGSVDAVRHPERAIGLGDAALDELALATSTTGVAALFGIAEANGGERFISQVFAADGEVRAVQRKRFPAPDEQGYTPGTDTAGFELGGVPMACVICFEGGVEAAWDRSVATGAAVVWFCSAPGLDGRRTDEASWQSGLDWWEGEGLTNARAQAERRSIWVGMATQAGATVDEDFPGVSALIGPDGEVVDRLPDWRPGVLLVDLPVGP